jgi:hypothetical protein
MTEAESDMATHPSSWKRRERDGAKLFGARRQVLSGSSGRAEATCSDSTHERLFIETKLRASSSVRSLWEKTRDLARREQKTPMLMLYTKHKPGALIVVHENDLAAVATELAAAAEQALEPSACLQDAAPSQPGKSA